MLFLTGGVMLELASKIDPIPAPIITASEKGGTPLVRLKEPRVSDAVARFTELRRVFAPLARLSDPKPETPPAEKPAGDEEVVYTFPSPLEYEGDDDEAPEEQSASGKESDKPKRRKRIKPARRLSEPTTPTDQTPAEEPADDE
jgi:hypothetical protein